MSSRIPTHPLLCVCSALLVLDHMKWARRAAALGLFGLLRRLRHERAGCSSGGEWPLPPESNAQGCCAVVARPGPRCCRSGECKQALSRHTPLVIVLSFGFVQHPRSGRRLRRSGWAALGLGRGHLCCRSDWWSQAFKKPFQFIFCSGQLCFPRWAWLLHLGRCARAVALVVLWRRARGSHGV